MATQMKHKNGRALTLGSYPLLGLLGLTFAFSTIGCGSSPPPKSKNAGSVENEETGTMGGEEPTEKQTISKAGAADLIPKEK